MSDHAELVRQARGLQIGYGEDRLHADLVRTLAGLADAVERLQAERDLAVAGLREVRQWERSCVGAVNDFTSLRRIVETRLVPLEDRESNG